MQEIYQIMKEPISGETIFEEFIEKIERNQEAFAVQNPYTTAQIVSMVYANIENAGYIKMIVGNIPTNLGLRRPGTISKITLQERLRKPEDHPGLQISRGMQPMCNPHKPTRCYSPICSRTTSWLWQISQLQHNPTENLSRC